MSDRKKVLLNVGGDSGQPKSWFAANPVVDRAYRKYMREMESNPKVRKMEIISRFTEYEKRVGLEPLLGRNWPNSQLLRAGLGVRDRNVI